MSALPHGPQPLALERAIVGKMEKLIPNLQKKKYVLHYRDLKQALEMGLKSCRFIGESPLMWKRVWSPTSSWPLGWGPKRKTSLRKILSTREQFRLRQNDDEHRNRVDVRLRSNENSAAKLVSKPNYERTTIFDENLVAVHMRKTELVFNKPVYLGMAILNISKTLMYDFHYNYIKKK